MYNLYGLYAFRVITFILFIYPQTVKAFARSILDNNHGHFVTIASMAGHYGGTQITEYSASKHAVVGFEDSMFCEFELYKRSGVFSTIISPFYTSTGMFDGIEKT